MIPGFLDIRMRTVKVISADSIISPQRTASIQIISLGAHGLEQELPNGIGSGEEHIGPAGRDDIGNDLVLADRIALDPGGVDRLEHWEQVERVL